LTSFSVVDIFIFKAHQRWVAVLVVQNLQVALISVCASVPLVHYDCSQEHAHTRTHIHVHTHVRYVFLLQMKLPFISATVQTHTHTHTHTHTNTRAIYVLAFIGGVAYNLRFQLMCTHIHTYIHTHTPSQDMCLFSQVELPSISAIAAAATAAANGSRGKAGLSSQIIAGVTASDALMLHRESIMQVNLGVQVGASNSWA